jgi:cytochrome c oxidase subunit I
MNMVQKAVILLIPAIFFNAILFAFIWAYREIVFGHKSFVALLGLLLFLLIAIPVTFLAIQWLVTQYKGRHMLSPAAVFLLGFFMLLTGDLMSKRVLGSSTLDLHVQDTYIVIEHPHVMIFFALIFLAFSIGYFLYPWIFGRVMNAPMGYIHFGITLVAAYLFSWPIHNDGLAGMPRRYIDYSDWTHIARYGYVNVEIKTILVVVCAQLLFLFNLIYSAFKGPKWRPLEYQ